MSRMARMLTVGRGRQKLLVTVNFSVTSIANDYERQRCSTSLTELLNVVKYHVDVLGYAIIPPDLVSSLCRVKKLGSL